MVSLNEAMNGDREKVSFIIPVLNREVYIKKCIDFVIHEMKCNDEIIVVDNGSTDNTLKIVGQYKQINILKFLDVSISTLRNQGAKKAKGDYLAFIDSDCILCDGWRDAVDRIMNNDEISATGSCVDIPKYAKWIEKAWYSKRWREEKAVNYINSGNLVVRRDVFQSIGGFNEALITDEDYEIGLRLKRSGYFLIDAPSVRVIHLGNPKTIKEFYAKEKWRATSMLSSLAINKMDKPLIMTIIFMLCCMLSVLSLPLVFFKFSYLIVFPVLLLFAPFVTGMYRMLQFKNYYYFFHLIFLYFIYFSARACVLINLIKKKFSI